MTIEYIRTQKLEEMVKMIIAKDKRDNREHYFLFILNYHLGGDFRIFPKGYPVGVSVGQENLIDTYTKEDINSELKKRYDE